MKRTFKTILVGHAVMVLVVIEFLVVLPLASIHPKQSFIQFDIWFLKQGYWIDGIVSLELLSLLFAFMYYCLQHGRIAHQRRSI